MAAAFGFEVAEDLLGPAAPTMDADKTPTGAGTFTSPVFAAAKALGVGAGPAPVPAIVPAPSAAAPGNAEAASAPVAVAYGPPRPAETSKQEPSAVGMPPERHDPRRPALAPAMATSAPAAQVDPAEVPAPEAARAPAPPAGDAAAARLEAALLDQLRSLEETLQMPPPRMPPAEPLRMPAPRHPAPARLAEPAGAPGRSPFAPDPIRQRAYIDLSDPAPAEPVSPDDAPWRKYLAEPPRRTPSRPIRSSPRPTARALPVSGTATAREVPAPEHGSGLRAMAAAAVLGLGVGLGLLLLLRPFDDSLTTAALDSDPPPAVQSAEAPAATAPPLERDDAVDDALATLLAKPSAPQGPPDGTAVIAEAGTPAEALVVAQTEPPEVVAPRPPLISPPPGQPIPVTRGAMYGPERTLAYGPSTSSYDPVAQSLLREQAEEAAIEDTDPAQAPGTATPRPAASARDGSRATINTFVNLRAQPDNGSPVVAVLAQGLSVKVIGCDYWCEVEAGGKRGYVFKKFVSR